MQKGFFAIALSALLLAPEALARESLVRKTDWRERFALPAPAADVPWLNIDPRTKLPKSDLPIGRDSQSLGRLVLQPSPNIQMTFREEGMGRL